MSLFILLKGIRRMLFNFIRFDIYNGILKKKKKLASIFMIFLAINILYTNYIFAFIKNGIIPCIKVMNLGDYIMYYLSGISEYIPNKNTPFPLPFLWMFQSLGCCYFCLHYPLEDLRSTGKHRLILCGNRCTWWISKCVWTCVNVLVYYITAYISSLLVGAVVGVSFSGTITEYTIYLLRLTGNMNIAPYDGTLQFLIIPLVLCSICILQMLLSLIIKPIYSFIAIATYLLASAYFKTPLLIGNFAMLARSSLIDVNGFSVKTVLFVTLSVMITSIICGNIIFMRKDVL